MRNKGRKVVYFGTSQNIKRVWDFLLDLTSIAILVHRRFCNSRILDNLLWGSTVGYPSLASCSHTPRLFRSNFFEFPLELTISLILEPAKSRSRANAPG